MKATVKKFLRCTFPILLVSLILALFSVSAFAEEADPGDTWWSRDMETGILYVDGDVPQCDYWLGYYPPWYEWREAITEVRISEGVEEIGDDGFAECSNMTKVTLPSTLKTIGDHAFVYCYELTAFSVDEKNPYFTSDDQGVLYTKDMKTLLKYPQDSAGSMMTIEYIRNAMKRVRKKESSMILASQNIEDFLIPSIREFTKPMFSIPSHQFLFNPGQINPAEFMDALQMEPSEFELIKYPAQGLNLYRCGNERYLLQVIAPEYKTALFGSAGGR